MRSRPPTNLPPWLPIISSRQPLPDSHRRRGDDVPSSPPQLSDSFKNYTHTLLGIAHGESRSTENLSRGLRSSGLGPRLGPRLGPWFHAKGEGPAPRFCSATPIPSVSAMATATRLLPGSTCIAKVRVLRLPAGGRQAARGSHVAPSSPPANCALDALLVLRHRRRPSSRSLPARQVLDTRSAAMPHTRRRPPPQFLLVILTAEVAQSVNIVYKPCRPTSIDPVLGTSVSSFPSLVARPSTRSRNSASQPHRDHHPHDSRCPSIAAIATQVSALQSSTDLVTGQRFSRHQSR
ncbi:hypothetical protein QBC39DRAFT_23119 [Podospora conica]|nr:hypothetical protein QBC39DRAFT_23119 [Schizothecium conicum]